MSPRWSGICKPAFKRVCVCVCVLGWAGGPGGGGGDRGK